MALPDELRPPLDVALAKAVKVLPEPKLMPGGAYYEPKWDGFRVLIVRDGSSSHGPTTLWSRQGKNLTRHFPELVTAAAQLIPDGFIVDGEAVIWTGDRLNFEALQARLTTAAKDFRAEVRAHPASFAAFDVLAVSGNDSRVLPYVMRRQLLEKLSEDWEPPLSLSMVTSDVSIAAQWLREFPEVGIEGLVVKAGAGTYRGGERDWLKMKHRASFDVVCAAVTGTVEKPKSLIVGLPLGGPDELRIIGRTPALAGGAARRVARELKPVSPEDHPWPAKISGGRYRPSGTVDKLTLVEPFVVEVSADTAWSGTSFRHPVRFLRVRPELNPDDVVVPEQLR